MFGCNPQTHFWSFFYQFEFSHVWALSIYPNWFLFKLRSEDLHVIGCNMDEFYYKSILKKCLFAVTRPTSSKCNLSSPPRKKKINSNFRHCFFIFNGWHSVKSITPNCVAFVSVLLPICCHIGLGMP